MRTSVGRLHGRQLMLALGLLAAGCAPESRPIRYGEEDCAHCMMTVSDQRYGAEMVTRKGKVHAFDSVECMAAYVVNAADIHELLVTDFGNPPELVPAEEAVFLRSDELRSPMGMNLTAFSDTVSPDSLIETYGGEVLSWAGVVELVRARRTRHE